MLRSLYSGVSGMKSFQTKLDVIGNNIANVNTYGFKQGRVTFKDMVSQTLRDATNNANPIQVGSGTQVGSIDTIDTQGSLQSTGRTLDLAIQGDGYLQVKSAANGQTYYTRAGNLYLDQAGDLVTASGDQVLDSSSAAINIPTGSTDLSISPDGKISYLDNAGAAQSAQLGLVLFPNPEGLTKVGANEYQQSNNSGAATGPFTPGQSGSGTIQSGFLEMSNVDLADQMTEMIVAQRGFQANTKIITTSDQILQELINMKQ